jgi:hypothetical protein
MSFDLTSIKFLEARTRLINATHYLGVLTSEEHCSIVHSLFRVSKLFYTFEELSLTQDKTHKYCCIYTDLLWKLDSIDTTHFSEWIVSYQISKEFPSFGQGELSFEKLFTPPFSSGGVNKFYLRLGTTGDHKILRTETASPWPLKLCCRFFLRNLEYQPGVGFCPLISKAVENLIAKGSLLDILAELNF